MKKWVLLALDEGQADGLAELVLAHLRSCVGIGGDTAEAEFILGATLLLALSPPDKMAAEDLDAAQHLIAHLRRTNTAMHGNAQDSRRLSWPADLAWIEAQYNAGNLA